MTRESIRQKLAGQEQVARNKLLDSRTADTLARFRAEVPSADSIATVRLIEAQAALAYWTAWRTLPINFPRNDLRRVPAHWLNFGTRISPLKRSPRLSVTAPLLDSPDPKAQMWLRGLSGLAGRCQITCWRYWPYGVPVPVCFVPGGGWTQ